MQPDLFKTSPVSGLTQHNAMIDPAWEQELIGFIDRAELAPFRFQGWLGKRLTAAFGWSYDFERGRMAQGSPIPEALLPVRAVLADRAGVAVEELVQALVIRYDPGAGIGWHRDRPQFDTVIGLSLGAPVTLRLRRRQADDKFERRHVPLAPRGAYVLAGEVRQDWEHSIAPIDRPRWSVTFRSLSTLGLRAIA